MMFDFYFCFNVANPQINIVLNQQIIQYLHKSLMYSICSLSFFALFKLIYCRYLFSNPFPLTTPSHLKPGLILYRLGGPSNLQARSLDFTSFYHLFIGSFHILLFFAKYKSSCIYFSSSDFYFFIPFSHSANLYMMTCFRFYFYSFYEHYFIVPSLFLYIVFIRASSGIYMSEDSDFSNIANLFPPTSFYYFLSFFFFFFLFSFSCLTQPSGSYLLMITDLLFLRQDKIYYFYIPQTCKLPKNYSSSASFQIPKAFRSFFFNFLSFFRYFYILFYFFYFGPCSFTYQSEEATLTLFLTSYDIDYDQEDEGSIIQSSSLIQIFASIGQLDIFFILVGAGLAYLLKSFFFFSASLIPFLLFQLIFIRVLKFGCYQVFLDC